MTEWPCCMSVVTGGYAAASGRAVCATPSRLPMQLANIVTVCIVLLDAPGNHCTRSFSDGNSLIIECY